MHHPLPIHGPLGLGDILDRAFRLYRARFRTMLLTTAVLLVPVSVLSGLVTGRFMTNYMDILQSLAAASDGPSEQLVSSTLSSVAGYGALLFFFALASLVANGLVSLSITSHAIAALHGETLTLGQGLRQGARRFFAYVGMVLLQWIATVVATLALLIPLILLLLLVVVLGGFFGLMVGDLVDMADVIAGIGLIVLMICGFLLAYVLFLAPTVYLSARWLVGVPALLAEELAPAPALARSWRLSRGQVLRTIGYTVLLFIIMTLVISLPMTLLQQLLMVLFPSSFLGPMTTLSAILSSLLSVVWTPFYAIAVVLLYYDLRARREGYHLEQRVEHFVRSVERGLPDLADVEPATASSTDFEPGQNPL